jgi:predicted GIY-YIG superfamily endonuclease
MRHCTVHRHGYVCYLLYSVCNRKFYTGITNRLRRRVRQHNGLIAGGGKYTSRFRPWKLVAYISGFHSHIEVLRYEWRCKRARGTWSRVTPLARALGRFRLTCESQAWWVPERHDNHSLRAHFVYEGPARSVLQTFDSALVVQNTLSRLPPNVLFLILEIYLSHGVHYAAMCHLSNKHLFSCRHNTKMCALCEKACRV